MGRRIRRLLVGADVYRWGAGHAHTRGQDDMGRPRLLDCREVLTIGREGSPGRLDIVFRAGPGRLVADGLLHNGAVVRADDDAYLNLHRPGVVRALLDEALHRGHGFDTGRAEIDGWDLLDGALERLAAADSRAS
ncbi:hypothetical protein Acsp04_32800 [Actinomadura sp. NBRC 104425]|uniref:hypothetical protein n=1 Tax=Actinomadura sp. NBRC 104425 TaxID=3032204 RepID=UPI0024A3EC37|nr:hypothetical protein [Actinomadura sp. NBRC 104425]GLZ13045.1 hypothetical protein Acsp04_32800 [Actinomadura sp. NBRC 104425]